MKQKKQRVAPPVCESRGRSGERGSALVLAIFVIVMLATTGIVLLTIGQNEVKMGKVAVETTSVYYLAEAAVEDGRALLLSNGLSLTDSLAAAAGGNGVIDFDPELLEPVFDDDGSFVKFDGYGDDVPLRAEQAFGEGRYMVFLTNDPADADPVTDSNQRVMLTGVAVGSGEAYEVVQAMVSPVPLMPTPPPCVLTLLGPDPLFWSGTTDCTEVSPGVYDDEDKEFDGEDCNGLGEPGLVVPTVCIGGFIDSIGSDEDIDDEGADEYDDSYDAATLEAYATAAKQKITDEILDDACPSDFQANPSSGADTIANLDDYLNEPLLGPDFDFDPRWTDCFELKRLVERIRERAGFICQRDTCEFDHHDHWNVDAEPTATTDTIVVADGKLTKIPSGWTGAGLLVVTGALEMDGTATWEGTILVIGKGHFVRTGSGGYGPLTGAAVVANIAGADTLYGTADDCIGGLHGFGTPVYAESANQTGNSNYCSTDIGSGNQVWSYGGN
jgi:hypothetical protein